MTTDRVYIVQYNADLEEGRGPMVLDCAFTNERAAIGYAEAKYDYYKHGAIKQGWARIHGMTMFHTASEALDKDKLRLREQALRKLSTEEKAALGLADE